MFSILSNFKHRQEMRESKDEILVGEIVRAMARMKFPAIGFVAGADQQAMKFKAVGDPVLNSVSVTLDRKTGGGAIQQALIGSKATLAFQAEVKNYLADPDDLVRMYRTDLQNIFKMPMLGSVRLDHQLNSVIASKTTLIDIDEYILKGEEGVARTVQMLTGQIDELRDRLRQFKKAS